MKNVRFVGAVALVLSLASLACADQYNNTAGSRTLMRHHARQRTYRSYSYVPQQAQTVAPAQASQAAPAQAAQGPAVAHPAQQPQARVAQTAPRRAYRSYSYEPYGRFWDTRNEPTWSGLGKNGDHYYSRADNKVFSRGGQGW